MPFAATEKIEPTGDMHRVALIEVFARPLVPILRGLEHSRQVVDLVGAKLRQQRRNLVRGPDVDRAASTVAGTGAVVPPDADHMSAPTEQQFAEVVAILSAASHHHR